MSKKLNVSQSNTLFNYFSSPKGKPTPKKKETNESPKLTNQPNLQKQETNSDSEDEIVPVKSKKRSRIFVHSDSDSENGSPNRQTSSAKRSRLNSDSESEEDSANHVIPKRRPVPKDLSVKSFSFQKSVPKNEATNDDASRSSSPNSDVSEFPICREMGSSPNSESSSELPNCNETETIHTNWAHNKLDFMKPETIMDAQKRRPNDPNYDAKTLFVPSEFLNSQTPAMRQWWGLKSSHMDSVLFFKVGKFYELYHMDAVIGVKHLGFSYMKGEFAHSGFPETAYAKMVNSLIEQGFKVARVEQTETPEMMTERVKHLRKSTKFDKVVNRELCQITTKATCIYSAQMPDPKNAPPCYLFAVTEKVLEIGKPRLGVCFIDTSIGTFHLAEFNDDKHYSRTLAMFSEYPPGLILLERGRYSSGLLDLLKTYFIDTPREILASGTEFYCASITLQKLMCGPYFDYKGDTSISPRDEKFTWPPFFEQVLDGWIPRPEYELALKALGACVWYLKDSKIDVQIISMQKFELYHPLDLVMKNREFEREYMVLDAISLENLSILGEQGTLQKTLDYCETAFGKRLLQQWICRPLCHVRKIQERQHAVQELYKNPAFLESVQDILKKLPDLERQVAKIHAYGNKYCGREHPDSRAIFYEEKTYSKRKITDLLKTLQAFERSQELCELFKGCNSSFLRKITQFPPVGMFVDLSSSLQFFKEAFDQNAAEIDGKMIPRAGVDGEYDAVGEWIASIENKLNTYLAEQKCFFGCKVTYFGTDKKRFQIEVPEIKAHKATNDYQLEGSRKGISKRFSTPETRQWLQEMIEAETERDRIVRDLSRKIFEKFSQRREKWERTIHCLAQLDVICSLAQFARSYSYDVFLPKIRPIDGECKIIINDGRHPCIENIDDFVPNDIRLGVKDFPPILILTGPNMGGKSTLMRQVAIISIIAQLGSYVPASYCEISLIDRVFTRLGAHDNIVGGQSTFFTELAEASAILQHATPFSLVLVDELGRGTATHDGNAVATAYVEKLLETTNCRTIFSTHYHSLVDHFVRRDDIQIGHMACMVVADADSNEGSVTFLYKMAQGRCPRSYGFNAARLAGLPEDIIERGRELAKRYEETMNNRRLICKLLNLDIRNVRKALKDL